MSCGHAIDPQCLFYYASSSAEEGKAEIHCPYVDQSDPRNKCNALWSFKEMKKMGLFTKEEKEFFEFTLSENFIAINPEFNKCKHCELPYKASQSTKRVECKNCKYGLEVDTFFCNECRVDWPNKEGKDCPNPKCNEHTVASLGKLEVMPRIQIDGEVLNAIQPCPKCNTWIWFIGSSYCKTVLCPCGWNFCFRCRCGDNFGSFEGCSRLLHNCKSRDR